MGTEIKPGGTGTQDRAPAAYFRHTFTVADPAALENLELHVRRDDGVAVYLNGKEIARDNMPEGDLTPDSTALKTISGEEEKEFLLLGTLQPGDVVSGENILAVEVHQDRPISSDLHFDLWLAANTREATDAVADYWAAEGTSLLAPLRTALPPAYRLMGSERP
jgi:hypothetical protein